MHLHCLPISEQPPRAGVLLMKKGGHKAKIGAQLHVPTDL